MLPIDAAKTRLQTATPGTPRDVGLIKNLQMMYREGDASSHPVGLCSIYLAPGASDNPANIAQKACRGHDIFGLCRRPKDAVCGHSPHSDKSFPSQCCAVAGLGICHEVGIY